MFGPTRRMPRRTARHTARRMSRRQAAAPPSGPEEPDVEELERARIKKQGIITPEEFRTKKNQNIGI